jgi:hypothetical protein
VSNIKTARLEVHPAAKIFPLMRGQEYVALRDDIKVNGLQWPVILHGGLLLDGRNRESACLETGTELRTIDGTEMIADPWAYVISVNLRRRHLTDQQKREAIAAYLAQAPEKSDRQVGKELGVDGKTVARARAEGEDVRKVPHVAKRTDTKGRKQPAKKPPARPKHVVVQSAGKTTDEVHAEVMVAMGAAPPTAGAPAGVEQELPATESPRGEPSTLSPRPDLAPSSLELELTERLRAALGALRTARPAADKRRMAIRELELLIGLLKAARLEPIDLEIVIRTAGAKRTVH